MSDPAIALDFDGYSRELLRTRNEYFGARGHYPAAYGCSWRTLEHLRWVASVADMANGRPWLRTDDPSVPHIIMFCGAPIREYAAEGMRQWFVALDYDPAIQPEPETNMPAKQKSPRVVTQIVRKIHDIKAGILDGTATVPDLLDDLSEAERLAYSLDGRRGALDPSQGGKVK